MRLEQAKETRKKLMEWRMQSIDYCKILSSNALGTRGFVTFFMLVLLVMAYKLAQLSPALWRADNSFQLAKLATLLLALSNEAKKSLTEQEALWNSLCVFLFGSIPSPTEARR